MDLLYFVLLISVLISIHELGHFAFAKFFGVKVLTFSLGFGPKLLRFRGRETEYCVALVPLGGFVKMLEEGKGEAIPPEEKKRTFEAQVLWKRVVIVLAGPAMNIIFPVLLYTSVFIEDRALLPPTVGSVLPGRPAEGRLLPGDRILSVDDDPVESFPEVQRIVAGSAGRALRFRVERDGHPVDVTVTPADEQEVRELDIVEHVGRIGIVPTFEAPVIGVPRPDSPAYRAGLRTFDHITAINGRKVERLVDLVSTLAANHGDSVVLTYLRPVDVPRALGGLCDVAVYEPGIATLTPLSRGGSSTSSGGQGRGEDAAVRAEDVDARAGIQSADMFVSFVPEGSSEWKAGLRAGDRVLTLDGVPQRRWQVLEDELVHGANRMRTLTWTRSGEPMAGSFQLRKEAWDDEFGQNYERYVFRTTHWAPAANPELVPNPHRLAYAVRRGLEETGSVLKFITVGFLRILQGRVSLETVSGPITLYDIAGQAGARGTTYFVWAMALISLNLGLVNLLPIPVLDGGHLFFFLVEGVSRRPVSLRVREVASLVGMGVLVVLMLIAFKNDVSRHWSVVVGQIHDVLN